MDAADEAAKGLVAAMTGERLSLRQIRERMAQTIRDAVAAERERCAQVAKTWNDPANPEEDGWPPSRGCRVAWGEGMSCSACDGIAKAILEASDHGDENWVAAQRPTAEVPNPELIERERAFRDWFHSTRDELAEVGGQSADAAIRLAFHAGYGKAAWVYRPASEQENREREEINRSMAVLTAEMKAERERAKPRWTKDAPAVPGWYWCRGVKYNEKPNLAWVGSTQQGLQVLMLGFAASFSVAHENFGGAEWCGPLEVPA